MIDRRRVTYHTHRTCPSLIEVELDADNVVRDVVFVVGCNGNLQGIRSLVVGMKAEDVIHKLDGIRCGYKSTSCPDQLCRSLVQAMAR